MGVRSSVDLLPVEVRDELNQQLALNSFSGYENLSAWLGEQGYAISRSAVQRYGQRYDVTVQRIKYATAEAEKFVKNTTGSNALSQATVRIAQEKIYELLLASEEGDINKLLGVCSAIAKLTTSQGSIERYQREAAVAERIEAAERGAQAAKAAGLSPDAAKMIRAAVEGVPVA